MQAHAGEQVEQLLALLSAEVAGQSLLVLSGTKWAAQSGCVLLTHDVTTMTRYAYVDCLLPQGPLFGQDEAADNELQAGLPFIEMVVVGQAEFDLYV